MPGMSPVIVPVRQRTPQWLEAREHGIGASEAAAAIGVSPWESPIGLWARKLGLVPAPEETIPMRIGSELEPLIARLYTEATGVKVRRAVMLRQHPAHAFMLASLDRRAGRKPVELKYSARGTGYGEPGTDDVPDEVLVQVLHQLAVVDEDEADVAAIIAGRPEVQIYTIRREAAAEAAIVESEAGFWDHVQSRTEPPVDGSEATRRALNAMYPRGLDETVLEADPTLVWRLMALRQVRQRIDEEETKRAEYEAEIKAAMLAAGATVVRAPGVGEIPWRATKDRETTDWKALALGLRAAIEQMRAYDAVFVDHRLSEGFGTTDLDEVHAIHTTTKPSAPRFGPPRWEQED